ncbi:hypothetical protein LIPSTDRAFT_192878 [Lipomyces starkeyi NRRL Y-11557]|uniref:Uncharacterized protein n=1 Tax=Lipomyces starkeyi NRRL Y-11557 TaxID=675824 RepID=A0A1E3PWJ3_LIPST|nr:hypothetical protein LIPSTDRAFT_192878 [Lipomyces starkeyi NRRL Y-11557]
MGFIRIRILNGYPRISTDMTNQDCFIRIRIRIRIRLMSIRIRNFLRISADISVIRVSVPIPTIYDFILSSQYQTRII